MQVEGPGRAGNPLRIVPEVLASPSLGNYLPATLYEFASVLDPNANPPPAIRKLTFAGPGMSSYSSMCVVEFLVPDR